MDTTMDFTVPHAQRVEQTEREIARRLLIDESRIRPARRPDVLWRTALRDLLLARYDRLTEQTQQVLRLISVGRVRARHDLLAAVFTGSAAVLDTAAREAVSAHVLVVDEQSHAFRHALVHGAVGSDLLPDERARFHTRFAEELAARARVPRRGGDGLPLVRGAQRAKAFPATPAAMAEAVPRYAFRTAAQLRERAPETWDQLPDPISIAGRSRSDLLAQTTAALCNAGDGERALAPIDLAIAAVPPDDPARRAELLPKKARYLRHTGHPGSNRLLQEALALLPAHSTGPIRARILAELAYRLMLEARMADAITMARAALAGAQAVGPPPFASAAAKVLGTSRIHSGEVAAGMADLAGARALAHGDHRAAEVPGERLGHDVLAGAARRGSADRRKGDRQRPRARHRAGVRDDPGVQRRRPAARPGAVGPRRRADRPDARLRGPARLPPGSAPAAHLVDVVARRRARRGSRVAAPGPRRAPSRSSWGPTPTVSVRSRRVDR